MQYKWVPKWQFLDRDDLLHFFCLIKIRVKGKDLLDREFPPRLRRQFTKTGNGHYFAGRVDNLEWDDVAYLSKFLKITVPKAVVEASNFSSRIRMHLTQNAKTGDYLWTPDIRILDCDDVPHVLPWFEFSVSADRFHAGDFPGRLRSHFKATNAEAA